MKALYWEGNGFVLLYKRLESGSFQWPRTGVEAKAITSQQYRWLMEGLSVEQPKAHRPAVGLSMLPAEAATGKKVTAVSSSPSVATVESEAVFDSTGTY